MLEDTLDPERAILVSQSDKRRVLLIVFIEVSEDTIRIISAGRATSHKRRRYEEGVWQGAPKQKGCRCMLRSAPPSWHGSTPEIHRPTTVKKSAAEGSAGAWHRFSGACKA